VKDTEGEIKEEEPERDRQRMRDMRVRELRQGKKYKKDKQREVFWIL
jgi:hypothetical protein